MILEISSNTHLKIDQGSGGRDANGLDTGILIVNAMVQVVAVNEK